MDKTVPVVLFAYSRSDHLIGTLESLRFNEVPLIYAFSDGPKTSEDINEIAKVRDVLRDVDWCDLDLCCRKENLGLGRSILMGVSAILNQHDSVIVFEDDLICVPGTYKYMCEALKHYSDNYAVMSVTGWTHPRVTPSDVGDQPYFDGRAECWVWGTWARSWVGMERNARALMRECAERGIDSNRYGDDLPVMAEEEEVKNIWAVRFLYLHMLRGGLCLRPPHSMVDHRGFDDKATNAGNATEWAHWKLKDCPPIPAEWPPALEHPDCALLWREACRPPNFISRVKRKMLQAAAKVRLSWT